MFFFFIFTNFAKLCWGEHAEIGDHLETSRPRCQYTFSVPIQDFGHVCKDSSFFAKLEEMRLRIEKNEGDFSLRFERIQQIVDSGNDVEKFTHIQQILTTEVEKRERIETQIERLQDEIQDVKEKYGRLLKETSKTNSARVDQNVPVAIKESMSTVDILSENTEAKSPEIEQCRLNVSFTTANIEIYQKSLPVGLHLCKLVYLINYVRVMTTCLHRWSVRSACGKTGVAPRSRYTKNY